MMESEKDSFEALFTPKPVPPAEEVKPSHDPGKDWEAALNSGKEAVSFFLENARARVDLAQYSAQKILKTALALFLTAVALHAALVFAVCLALYGLSLGLSELMGTGAWSGFTIVGFAFSFGVLGFVKWHRKIGPKKAKERWENYERELARRRSRQSRFESATRH